jgi:hypothetical protein
MLPLKSIFHSPTSIASSAVAPWEASRSASALADATSFLSTFMVSSPAARTKESLHRAALRRVVTQRQPLHSTSDRDGCGSALAKVTPHYASPTSANQ